MFKSKHVQQLEHQVIELTARYIDSPAWTDKLQDELAWGFGIAQRAGRIKKDEIFVRTLDFRQSPPVDEIKTVVDAVNKDPYLLVHDYAQVVSIDWYYTLPEIKMFLVLGFPRSSCVDSLRETQKGYFNGLIKVFALVTGYNIHHRSCMIAGLNKIERVFHQLFSWEKFDSYPGMVNFVTNQGAIKTLPAVKNNTSPLPRLLSMKLEQKEEQKECLL